MPQLLGQLLLVGGVGYLLSTLVSYVFANADPVAGLLTIPATIGEVWILGYLIVFEVRDHPRPDREQPPAAEEDPVQVPRSLRARPPGCSEERILALLRGRTVRSRRDLRL